MVRKCDTTKHRKLSKKQRASRREKKQQIAENAGLKIIDDSRLPEPVSEAAIKAEVEAMQRIVEATKPISPARRAFQDI